MPQENAASDVTYFAGDPPDMRSGVGKLSCRCFYVVYSVYVLPGTEFIYKPL